VRAVPGKQSGLFWWAAGSVAWMVIGSAGPWAYVIYVSVSGLEGDGLITLVVSVVCAAALWAFARGNRGALIVTGAGGTLVLGIGVYDASRIEALASAEILGQNVRAGTIGWGLVLTIAAGGSLALASLVLGLRRDIKARTEPEPKAGKMSTPRASTYAPWVAERDDVDATTVAAPEETEAPSAPPPAQSDASPTRAAGWYRNYLGSDQFRYWDGQRWTEHTSDVERSDIPARSD
jgi:Protein of unknown function (DUF2510)